MNSNQELSNFYNEYFCYFFGYYVICDFLEITQLNNIDVEVFIDLNKNFDVFNRTKEIIITKLKQIFNNHVLEIINNSSSLSEFFNGFNNSIEFTILIFTDLRDESKIKFYLSKEDPLKILNGAYLNIQKIFFTNSKYYTETDIDLKILKSKMCYKIKETEYTDDFYEFSGFTILDSKDECIKKIGQV